MSLFSDLFTSGYDKAAGAASTGYQAGYNQAVPLLQQGRDVASTNYAAALDPFNKLNASATSGADAYASALGIGRNPANALDIITKTPGFQGQLGAGLQAIDRGAASRGLTTSGNLLTAEQKYGNDLAAQYYQNYVNSLQPYLGQQTAAATGIANIDMGLANTLNSSLGNQANLAANTQGAIGNVRAAADVAGQNAQNTFLSGITNLGGKLLGSGAGSKIAGAFDTPLTNPNMTWT